MCMCVGVNNRIVTCEKLIFWFEKGYEWIGVPGSCKTYYQYEVIDFPKYFSPSFKHSCSCQEKSQRFNSNRFMTKQMRKAIIRRSRLKNIYNQARSPENWDNYKKQHSFCVDLLQKTKRSYVEQINIKDISDHKKFWNTIKLFFSNKELKSQTNVNQK